MIMLYNTVHLTCLDFSLLAWRGQAIMVFNSWEGTTGSHRQIKTKAIYNHKKFNSEKNQGNGEVDYSSAKMPAKISALAKAKQWPILSDFQASKAVE